LVDQLLVDCHGVSYFLLPMAVYTVLFTPSGPSPYAAGKRAETRERLDGNQQRSVADLPVTV